MADVQHPFAVSAPGKVIVFGEHAVVHGRPAIAAALSLRSYLLVSSNSPPDESLTLDFPDVALHHTWSIKDLPWALFAAKAINSSDRVTALDTDLVDALQPFLDPISPDASEHDRRVHKHAAMAFLYILLSLESPMIIPRTYTLRSTIPIASGLGSSASVSVCLSTAILAQIGQIPLGGKPNDSDSDTLLDTINNWAFVGELCIHGNPSGIDNTVATRGKAVWFKRNPPPHGPSVSLLHNFPTLPLLLVDTKQPRSTAIEVAKVKKLLDEIPEVANCALDAIGKVTSSVLTMISEGDFERNQAASMDKLGRLVRMNHGLLATFGVSHPKLERIRDIVDAADAGWTKLTGGGGGGCAFSLLNSRASADTLSNIESALDAEGFGRFETLLGAPGVGVLNIAQLPEDLATRDMKTLRGAQDSNAIEALMGIAAPDTAKYWQFFCR